MPPTRKPVRYLVLMINVDSRSQCYSLFGLGHIDRAEQQYKYSYSKLQSSTCLLYYCVLVCLC